MFELKTFSFKYSFNYSLAYFFHLILIREPVMANKFYKLKQRIKNVLRVVTSFINTELIRRERYYVIRCCIRRISRRRYIQHIYNFSALQFLSVLLVRPRNRSSYSSR
jgi:hypothetical protein